MTALLPRATLAAGAIVRWHVVTGWLRALAGPVSPLRVLDAGCGRGEYVLRLARECPSARLVVGVDQAGRDGIERPRIGKRERSPYNGLFNRPSEALAQVL